MSSVVGQTNDFDVIAITGNLDLDADIGADNFSAAGATSISVSGASNLGKDVTTSGTQTYTGAVTLSGEAINLKGTTIQFGSTVAGGTQNLKVDGIMDLNGAMTNVAILEVTGASDIGADISTTGIQTYTGAVTLSGAARTLTATNNSAVFIDGTINGTQNLTVATGGLTTFDGLVGNTTILGAIDISGAGGLDLDAAIA